jgi:hypothetical protein
VSPFLSLEIVFFGLLFFFLQISYTGRSHHCAIRDSSLINPCLSSCSNTTLYTPLPLSLVQVHCRDVMRDVTCACKSLTCDMMPSSMRFERRSMCCLSASISSAATRARAVYTVWEHRRFTVTRAMYVRRFKRGCLVAACTV